jgi:hypothetical protein
VLHDDYKENTMVWKLRGLNAELSHLPVDSINIYTQRERERERPTKKVLRIFQTYESQIQSYTNLLCTLLPSGM